MNESDKIILEIMKEIYPEWIERQKRRYPDLEGYDRYKQIILDTFGYDIDRVTMELERGIDSSSLERRIQIMDLTHSLKNEEKKKKRKKK